MSTTGTCSVAVSHRGETIALKDAPATAFAHETVVLGPSEPLQSPSEPQPAAKLTNLQKVVLTMLMSGITFTGSMINGIVGVALPAIERDLELPPSLAFWPASVSSLATASTLLLAGSVADVLGPRSVDLVGSFASGALMIAAGFSRDGPELVALRALQGVGLALHLASCVAIVTEAIPQGRGRNLAFSFLGLSQPFGLSVGLVLSGVFVDTIGWRSGWHLSGGLTLVLAIISSWALPRSKRSRSLKGLLHDLRAKVDWVGAFLSCACMTLLCYLLAILSADVSRIREPTSIACLSSSIIALVTFVFYMHQRVKVSKNALIPNYLWRNATFSTICTTIVLSSAVINSLELFSSLFFQEVQHLSALQASVRILPSTIVGTLTNLTIGLFVHRIPAVWIVASTSALCAVSAILMAVTEPSWPYWGSAFVSQMLQPLCIDALFTVGLIVITDIFPEDTQALAGAVFNTAAQFGAALGLAVVQVISTVVTDKQHDMGKSAALLEGYRASFWAMFAFMVLCGVVGTIGLRKTGKIGLKKE